MLEWMHTMPSHLLSQLQGIKQPSAHHGVLKSASQRTGTILTISHFLFHFALSICPVCVFPSHTMQQGMPREAS